METGKHENQASIFEWLDSLEPVPVRKETIILSVDVETWRREKTCSEETVFLLKLFKNQKVKATFFVLGSVAKREPDLVKRIADEGHEIGSHGWNHEQVFLKSPLQFREEMTRSFDLLSELTGSVILGYRAPHFSICPQTAWAFDALASVGFQYDSSIFPIAGRRYGIPNFPRGPVRISRNGYSILEVPLSTVLFSTRNIPVAGGGYFRLLPYPFIRHAVQVVQSAGFPFITYCHPYEFRKEPLRWPQESGNLSFVKAAILSAKFNLFRKTMRRKFTDLLRDFHLTSIKEAFFHAIPNQFTTKSL